MDAEDLRPTALAEFARILGMPRNGGGTYGPEGAYVLTGRAV
jgi:hypothetical protein